MNLSGNPHSETLGLSALKLTGDELPRVAEAPDDRPAREVIMLGHCMPAKRPRTIHSVDLPDEAQMRRRYAL
ncbi:hypothetical protein ACIQUB_22940 [Rhizobium sp. NPDC090275]|uniref:hypothetical protein n=1 Tax=Rhizobium sp. NPDC090275 TaxID=3364498 RepID=UPI003839EED2